MITPLSHSPTVTAPPVESLTQVEQAPVVTNHQEPSGLPKLEGFQSVEQRLPLVTAYQIAQELLHDDGTLNSSCSHPLGELVSLPGFQELIASISASPLHPKGHFLVRLCCQMSPDQSVTDRSVKLTVLTALLSKLRQGKVGNCFASAIAIGMMSWDPLTVAKDLKQLLAFGELRRGKEDWAPFPFLLKMPSDSIDQLVSVSREGKVEGVHLSEERGIQAALCAIGIPKGGQKRLISRFIGQTFRYSSAQTKALTARQVLKAVLAEHLKDCGLSRSDPQAFEERMALAFEGQIRSPLLRAWEQTLANMAEMGQGSCDGKTLSPYRNGLIQTLWLRLKLALPETLQEEASKALQSILKRRCRYLYDPCIEGRRLALDGHSSQGAWVLYDTHSSIKSDEWERVDTRQGFKRFVKRVIDELAQGLSCRYREEAAPIGPALKAALKDPQFIESYRKEYFGKVALQGLPDTGSIQPWLSSEGNWTEGVFQTYFERSTPPEGITIFPQSAEHLLNQILHCIREAPAEVQKRYRETPELSCPVSHRYHAFNLTLAHPSLTAGWQKGVYPREWIEKSLVEPGKRLGKRFVDQPFIEAVGEAVGSLVKHHKVAKAQKAVQALMEEEPMWRCDFRNRLINALLQIDKEIDKEAVDGMLFKALKDSEKQQIRTHSVQIADTNWYHKGNNVCYAIGFNPFSYRLELFVDNGTGSLEMTDQSRALLTNRWRFILNFDCLK